jgi:hypothetical protein
MREPADYDSGFVCKTCGRFYADKDVKQWNTKWTAPAEDSERTLVEIVTNVRCVALHVVTLQMKRRFAVFAKASRSRLQQPCLNE